MPDRPLQPPADLLPSLPDAPPDVENWGSIDWALAARRKLEDQVRKGMNLIDEGQELAAPALLEIHDRKLWAFTHDTWTAYIEDGFPRSMRTARRMLVQGREQLRALEAGPQNAKPQVSGRGARPVSQREAIKRDVARRLGEDPGPPPTEADRIAKASEAARRRSLQRHPTRKALDHHLKHLAEDDPKSLGATATDAEEEQMRRWFHAFEVAHNDAKRASGKGPRLVPDRPSGSAQVVEPRWKGEGR